MDELFDSHKDLANQIAISFFSNARMSLSLMRMRTHGPILILMVLCCGACHTTRLSDLKNIKLVHPPLVATPVAPEAAPTTATREKRKPFFSRPAPADNSVDLTNQLRDPDLLNKLDDPDQNPTPKTPNKESTNKPIIIKGSSTPPAKSTPEP